jgi:hypothetical protein
MSSVPFESWKSRSIHLLDGDCIFCYFFQPTGAADVSLHNENHNVYRLNPAGEIIWQVRRDDSNHPPDWWDTLHCHARERGLDGAREPFMYLQVEYADGTTSWDKQNNAWRDISEWKPGCTIWLQGSAYQQYILDPETGIAKNVTDWPVRPW